MTAMIVFSCLSCSEAWSGPASAIQKDVQGRTVISVGGGAVLPLFLSLNAQTGAVAAHNWTNFDYQIQLAASAQIPLLEVCLLDSTPTFLTELAQHVAVFPGYLIFRIDLYASGDLPQTVGQDEHGHVVDSEFYTLSRAWLSRKEQELRTLLPVLDAMFPGKLVAVRPTYLETGEWFYVPTTKAGGAPGTNGSYPWNSDLFYYGDYSADAHAEFCAWPELPPALQPNCSIPTAAVRLAANLGNTFVEGADSESARAILFTRFLAARVATAIITLAQVIKDVSSGKLLSMFFYGYLFELGWDVTAGHHALALLLHTPEIDILSAPYSYGVSRTVSVGFQPHGPADSLATSGRHAHVPVWRRTFVHVRPVLEGAQPLGLSRTHPAQWTDSDAAQQRPILLRLVGLWLVRAARLSQHVRGAVAGCFLGRRGGAAAGSLAAHRISPAGTRLC
jgi:hypothetical protein